MFPRADKMNFSRGQDDFFQTGNQPISVNCHSDLCYPAKSVTPRIMPRLHKPGLIFNPGQDATDGYIFIEFTRSRVDDDLCQAGSAIVSQGWHEQCLFKNELERSVILWRTTANTLHQHRSELK